MDAIYSIWFRARQLPLIFFHLDMIEFHAVKILRLAGSVGQSGLQNLDMFIARNKDIKNSW